MKFKCLVLVFTMLTIAACSGGGGRSSTPAQPPLDIVELTNVENGKLIGIKEIPEGSYELVSVHYFYTENKGGGVGLKHNFANPRMPDEGDPVEFQPYSDLQSTLSVTLPLAIHSESNRVVFDDNRYYSVYAGIDTWNWNLKSRDFGEFDIKVSQIIEADESCDNNSILCDEYGDAMKRRLAIQIGSDLVLSLEETKSDNSRLIARFTYRKSENYSPVYLSHSFQK